VAEFCKWLDYNEDFDPAAEESTEAGKLARGFLATRRSGFGLDPDMPPEA
jgi:hypothetical protein